mmetsp:Transcript_34121/g.99069  ORF Transcript_34121/g.99069 Transcript_34121/m.99069 type:complete len:235 (+) Transcript_34121:588-1292(+)
MATRCRRLVHQRRRRSAIRPLRQHCVRRVSKVLAHTSSACEQLWGRRGHLWRPAFRRALLFQGLGCRNGMTTKLVPGSHRTGGHIGMPQRAVKAMIRDIDRMKLPSRIRRRRDCCHTNNSINGNSLSNSANRSIRCNPDRGDPTLRGPRDSSGSSDISSSINSRNSSSNSNGNNNNQCTKIVISMCSRGHSCKFRSAIMISKRIRHSHQPRVPPSGPSCSAWCRARTSRTALCY